jgi:lipopolysaccharide transport system permease protein
MKLIISANPMTSIVEGIRFGILGGGTVSATGFLYSLCSSLLILLIGTVVFNRVEKSFIDTI